MDKIQRRYLVESGEAASMSIEISSKGLISAVIVSARCIVNGNTITRYCTVANICGVERIVVGNISVCMEAKNQR